MAAESTHWASVHGWILKVINSCTTNEQINSTTVLIKRYEETARIPRSLREHMIEVLYVTRNRKWDIILTKEVESLKQTVCKSGI